MAHGVPHAPVESEVATVPGVNVRFYRHARDTSHGGLRTMHSWESNYKQLEQNHAYIQWLFPNYWPSRFNWEAQALTPEEARIFREDPGIARRYLRSYCIFLDFLGLQLLDPVTGAVGRLPSGEHRLRAAIVENPHNRLRVQRVLASLAVTGFKRYVAPLSQHLEWEITGRNERVKSSLPLSGWCSIQEPALRAAADVEQFLNRLVSFADGHVHHYQQATKAERADHEESVLFKGLRLHAGSAKPRHLSQDPAQPPEGPTQVAKGESADYEELMTKPNDPSQDPAQPPQRSIPELPTHIGSGGQFLFLKQVKSLFAGCHQWIRGPRDRTPRTGRAAAASQGHGIPPGQSGVNRRRDIIARLQLPEDCLAEAYDWSYAEHGPAPFTRGGADYFPPYAFDKLGISTVKFDDPSFMDIQSGWHVAYHGTDPEDINQIIREGLQAKGGRLHPKHGNKFGDGIYASPKPGTARTFAGEVRTGEQNQETDVVLMARVRPGSYTVHDNGEVWLVKNHQDIRCHAVLFARS